MKKIYLTLITLLSLSAISIAQPILTPANFTPSVGDLQLYYVADTNTVIDNTTGANVIFDYSNMAGYGLTQTQYIVNPTTTTFASDFTSSTTADTTGGFAINKNYSQVHGTDSITKTGIVANIPTYGTVVGKYDVDPEITMKFPFSYPNTYFDNYSGSFTVSGVTANGAGNATVNADAWGTLLLPHGVSIDSVLRVKTSEYLITDTIVIPFVITINPITVIGENINYYKPSLSKFPLLSIVNGSYTQDNNIIDTSSAFICQYPLGTVGINEVNSNINTTVFPNPTNKDVTTLSFDLEEQANINATLLNSLGQNVKTIFNGVLPKGSNKMNIELSNLSKGLYFINLTVDGKTTTTKLLVE